MVFMFVVGVSFDVLVSVGIFGVVFFGVSNFDLFEVLLWQVFVISVKVVVYGGVFKMECRGQGVQMVVVMRCSVVDDFNFLVVFVVINSQVVIGRDFFIRFGYWSSNIVGVEVVVSLSVNQVDDRVVVDEMYFFGFGVVVGIVVVGVEELVVVGIFVVIVGNLLLVGIFRIGLDVRVKQIIIVFYVFNCGFGVNCNFEWVVFVNFGVFEVGLEEGVYLSIIRVVFVEDGEVKGEGE